MDAANPSTDLSLLEGLRDGRNPRAWQEFMRTYAPLLMSFAKRLGLADADAADAVQDTLLAILQTFRALPEPFDRRQGRFKAWLYGVAEHKIRDVKRRRARAAREYGADAPDAVAPDPALERIFETEWRAHLLSRALQQVAREVDPAVFQAFELYVVHGQPPEKVAALLGTTRNAVYISKTRVLQRVRATLAALMSEGG